MAKTPARCPALSRYQASEAGATRRGCRYPRLLSPHASSCPLTAMEKQSWRAGLASLAHLATGVAGPRRGLGNCCGIQGSSRGPQVWAGCRGGSDSLSQENDSATCWGAAGRSWVMWPLPATLMWGVSCAPRPLLWFLRAVKLPAFPFFCFKRGIGLTF